VAFVQELNNGLYVVDPSQKVGVMHPFFYFAAMSGVKSTEDTGATLASFCGALRVTYKRPWTSQVSEMF